VQVKEALTVLILQNIAVFEVSEKPGLPVEYSVSTDRILKRTRYEKYIYCAKRLHGDVAEVITEELLLHGQASQNRLVDLSLEKLNLSLEGNNLKIRVNMTRILVMVLKFLPFSCRLIVSCFL
jgi:hypothetical protein